jgi:hypothetical protein
MLLEKRKNRLLIEWSQVRVLLGEPDLCFGRIRLLLRHAATTSGSEPSMSNESCIDAPAVY